MADICDSAIIILISLGLVASYTGFILGQLKLKYPQITTMADAGEVLGGKFGREFIGACWILFFVFIMARMDRGEARGALDA